MTRSSAAASRAVATTALVAGALFLAIVLPARGTSVADVTILAAFGLAIALGEWFRVSAPGFWESAPIGTAAAFGLVFATEVGEGHHVSYAAPSVIAVTGVAMAFAALGRHLLGRQVQRNRTVGRFLAILVVALLFRSVHLGQVPGSPGGDDGLAPWQSAVLMLGIAAVGLLAQSAFIAVTGSRGAPGSLRRSFVDDVRSTSPLSSALAVTGVLIALAAQPLGLLSLPLFLIPLVLTQQAFRRYLGIRATYRQSIRTLARLTDLAGYTTPGHSERVAGLAVAMGREHAMSERELTELEYAALLHDIGQVALLEPIPGGATVLAAPADQRRIARDTVDIVRETGVLDEVAEILEHQTTPFRQMRELGEEIPLASRILKLVNAYEDLTGGARSLAAQEAAIERIHLGLGYEYDPKLVDLLTRVVRTPRP